MYEKNKIKIFFGFCLFIQLAISSLFKQHIFVTFFGVFYFDFKLPSSISPSSPPLFCLCMNENFHQQDTSFSATN